MKKPSRNSLTPLVAVCDSADRNKFALLEEALKLSGFWEVLKQARPKGKKKASPFRVLIKPDFEIYELGAATGTDPSLVEHLIELLAEQGCEEIAVADGLGVSDTWLENRDVMVLADMVGYRFETANGHPYEVVNLCEEVSDAGFPPESVLHGTSLGKAWLEADFRISFAKNKTDEANRFALGLQSLINILPLRAKDYHYQNRLQSPDVATDLLKYLPVHFALIDAVESNHGSQGARAVHSIDTHTVIACQDLLLADWVGALKMGLDPYGSGINAKALRVIGLPKGYRINGNLAPYPDWKNVSLIMAESVRRRNEAPLINRISRPWLQTVDTDLFPFRQVLDDQINNALAPIVKDVDNHPLAYWALVGLNYFLAGSQQSLEAWRILYDKDKLPRQSVPLDIDLTQYSAKDYQAISDYIMPLAQIAAHTPPDRNGLRWRYIDNSVLFEYSKILPIRYDRFVDQVDIAQSVQMMYDNIGGTRVAVKYDRRKRVIHQAERDIYLPQPNWMVLFGGKFIDVGKLEEITYGRDSQRICWRTVTSSNQSAEFDDGLVTFEKDPGGTKITIVARQKFALPLIWQALDLDYFPKIKDALVSDSYIRFFSRTMANFEAAAEGRNTRMGKQWEAAFGEADADLQVLTLDQLKGVLSMFSGIVSKWISTNGEDKPAGFVAEDENGYHHFSPQSEASDPITGLARDFLGDVAAAIQKDIRLIGNSAKKDPS